MEANVDMAVLLCALREVRIQRRPKRICANIALGTNPAQTAGG
jgi:hypothetical protein